MTATATSITIDIGLHSFVSTLQTVCKASARGLLYFRRYILLLYGVFRGPVICPEKGCPELLDVLL